MPKPGAPLPTVREIMTSPAVSIVPDLRINLAVQHMRSHQVRRLPVLGNADRLVGIVALNEALVAEAKCRDANEDMPFVRDVMTDYVYTVAPDESIARAASLMASHGIGALPVVEDSKVIGIVTESDLFKFLATWLEPADAD